ncbi:unnamed protein product [Rhizoctonia solani]|uniref:Uncharacterized protein n=1 Tax=Rhizoctonia solani TaxID=456999 RepID=A0A8H3H767_9AGAM|nr:unnamed protein product [Rhizoctonia solani]
MNEPGCPVNSLNVASTFSRIVALVSFVVPSIFRLDSMLGMMMKDVLDILRLTQNSDQGLMDFGKYVDRRIRQLVLMFQNGQLPREPNVLKDLEELQWTLHTISYQISYISNSGGLGPYGRYTDYAEQALINRMRQRLNDSLGVFRLDALIELLANSPNPSTIEIRECPYQDHSEPMNTRSTPAGVSESSVSQIPEPSKPPVQELPRTQGQKRQATRFDLDIPSQHTSTVDRSPSPKGGEILMGFMNVERCRRSLRHNRSPTQTMKLAAALGRLAVLLDKAGRISEALAASQESADLYKSLAERVH